MPNSMSQKLLRSWTGIAGHLSHILHSTQSQWIPCCLLPIYTTHYSSQPLVWLGNAHNQIICSRVGGKFISIFIIFREGLSQIHPFCLHWKGSWVSRLAKTFDLKAAAAASKSGWARWTNGMTWDGTASDENLQKRSCREKRGQEGTRLRSTSGFILGGFFLTYYYNDRDCFKWT